MIHRHRLYHLDQNHPDLGDGADGEDVRVTYVIRRKLRYAGPLIVEGNDFWRTSKIEHLAGLKDGQPIEFKNDDDDDMPVSFREREYYQADDNEITDAGYTIEEIEDHLDDDPDGLPAELNDLLGGIAEAQEDYNEGEEE